MIDMGIVFEVERQASAIVQGHGHSGGVYRVHPSERSVLDPKRALVAQEHDPVAVREHSGSALGVDLHILAQLAGLAHPFPRGLVEQLHLGACMRERSEEHTSELQSLMRISYA